MNRLRTSLLLACLFAAALGSHALAEPRVAASDGASEQRTEAYREGQRALDRQDWADASKIFEKIAAGSGPEADAALYWKAYADWKQKMKKESLEDVKYLLDHAPEGAERRKLEQLKQTLEREVGDD